EVLQVIELELDLREALRTSLLRGEVRGLTAPDLRWRQRDARDGLVTKARDVVRCQRQGFVDELAQLARSIDEIRGARLVGRVLVRGELRERLTLIAQALGLDRASNLLPYGRERISKRISESALVAPHGSRRHLLERVLDRGHRERHARFGRQL